MFAVHLTLLQLNNVFQFALACVFSAHEEKEWDDDDDKLY